MSKYGFRNDKFTTKNLVAQGTVEVVKVREQAKSVPVLKIQYLKAGTTARFAYLYVATAGSLRLSSTKPTGTTGAHTAIGKHVATVA